MSRTILIVEDSFEDVDAYRLGFREACNGDGRLVHCDSGDEAMDYLRGTGRYAAVRPEPPGLVLLDLNLPGSEGRQILSEIKDDPRLRRIPVLVMTGSADRHDVDACYEAGANGYVVKPAHLDRFVETIAWIHDFWFRAAALPRMS